MRIIRANYSRRKQPLVRNLSAATLHGVKVRALFLLIIVVTHACNPPDQKEQSNSAGTTDSLNARNYSDYLRTKESEFAGKTYDYVGAVYRILHFEIPDSSVEDGVREWISLDKPFDSIQQLSDRDSLVVDAITLTLLLDYPLAKEFSFELKSFDGFTKGELVQMISKQYHEIYSIEEESATIKILPPDKRTGLYNRNTTNGKFGIWGHDLSDLVLSEIRIHRNKQGQFIVSLGIES